MLRRRSRYVHMHVGLIGVIGGLGYTPKMLKRQIDEVKEGAKDDGIPLTAVISFFGLNIPEGQRRTQEEQDAIDRLALHFRKYVHVW